MQWRLNELTTEWAHLCTCWIHCRQSQVRSWIWNRDLSHPKRELYLETKTLFISLLGSVDGRWMKTSTHLLDAIMPKQIQKGERSSGIWTWDLSHPKCESYHKNNEPDIDTTCQFIGVGGWSVDEVIPMLDGCNNVKTHRERSGSFSHPKRESHP